MTTRIHVVNFGSQTVEVEKINPTTKAPVDGRKEPIHVHGSADFYVYDSQEIKITEKTNG